MRQSRCRDAQANTAAKPLLNSAAARCTGKQGGNAAATFHNAAGPLLRAIAAKPLRDAQENKAATPLLNSLAYRRGIAMATADRFPHTNDVTSCI